MRGPRTLGKPKRKRLAPNKTKLNVDPVRLAVAAMDRIKTVFARKGQSQLLGSPTTMRELAARAEWLRIPLPPSYSAAMRIAGTMGEPEKLLTHAEMLEAVNEMSTYGSPGEVDRYAPFGRIEDRILCFDRESLKNNGELRVYEWISGTSEFIAEHFGAWLDQVADSREEQLERAAEIPNALRDLLRLLGFRFSDPIIGRLETGDTEAIEELIGPELVAEIRGDVDRLFDSSGKASLTLNVDEFSLAVALRTGIYVFAAEDVFRWLRYFRDENFFGENTRGPSHPDNVRDLRRAPREPQLILRGVLEVFTLAARKHSFRAAAGRSGEDFYLLGRTASTSDHAPSLLLHVVNGVVKEAQSIDEPLIALHAAPDGSLWGLSHQGTAVWLRAGTAQSFPLHRRTRGRAWWYGIGGAGNRVLVWGAGALLEFNGNEFVPFEPNAELEAHESVIGLSASNHQIAMLVAGDRMGALARFDGHGWAAIDESQVIEGQLMSLDMWRGVGIILTRQGEVWRVDTDGQPTRVNWDLRQQAFRADSGTIRPMHAVRGLDGGALVASDGGVIVMGAGEPIFHSAPPGCLEPVELSRVGGHELAIGRAPDDPRASVVATCGSHAWIWRKDAFYVIDLREW